MGSEVAYSGGRGGIRSSRSALKVVLPGQNRRERVGAELESRGSHRRRVQITRGGGALDVGRAEDWEESAGRASAMGGEH
ncbi:unnamed protein product [Calypogeia fissa]